jgi:hypothetical protein
MQSVPQINGFETSTFRAQQAKGAQPPQLTGEPALNAAGLYVASDSDGICYQGSSELDCYRQFMGAVMELRIAAEMER